MKRKTQNIGPVRIIKSSQVKVKTYCRLYCRTHFRISATGCTTFTPFPPRGFCYFASASRATADRSRELRRPPARPASTHTSLPHPRRKLLAMWPVRAARLPHLDMLPEVVWAGAQRQRPYDKDVLKNKDFLNRRLYSTIHSDHQHGPNAMSRCAYVLVGFG